MDGAAPSSSPAALLLLLEEEEESAAGEPSSNASGAWPGPGWSSGGAPRAGRALLLALTFALSALGNGAVVAAIARHRRLRTVPNAFVLSLALAELLAALLCLPPAFVGGLLPAPPSSSRGRRPPWLPGPRLCLASAALHAGLGAAAALTMALLAFERYLAIARRPRRGLGARRAAQLLAAAWLAALALAAPAYLLAGEGGPQDAPYCLYLLPWGSPSASSRLGAPSGAALIVLCYLLPFALMCFCHYHICRALRRSRGRVRPLTACGPLLRFYSEVRTATTVLIMIVSLICCWGPYCLLGLAAALGRLSFSPGLDAAASWMAWANGAVNPLIYAARNPHLSLLLGCSREGGYRTRGDGVGRGRRPEPKSRAECYASHVGGSALTSSSPASGGELTAWACRNPALLFCRDAGSGLASETPLQPKLGVLDTSL